MARRPSIACGAITPKELAHLQNILECVQSITIKKKNTFYIFNVVTSQIDSFEYRLNTEKVSLYTITPTDFLAGLALTGKPLTIFAPDAEYIADMLVELAELRGLFLPAAQLTLTLTRTPTLRTRRRRPNTPRKLNIIGGNVGKCAK